MAVKMIINGIAELNTFAQSIDPKKDKEIYKTTLLTGYENLTSYLTKLDLNTSISTSNADKEKLEEISQKIKEFVKIWNQNSQLVGASDIKKIKKEITSKKIKNKITSNEKIEDDENKDEDNKIKLSQIKKAIDEIPNLNAIIDSKNQNIVAEFIKKICVGKTSKKNKKDENKEETRLFNIEILIKAIFNLESVIERLVEDKKEKNENNQISINENDKLLITPFSNYWKELDPKGRSEALETIKKEKENKKNKDSENSSISYQPGSSDARFFTMLELLGEKKENEMNETVFKNILEGVFFPKKDEKIEKVNPPRNQTPRTPGRSSGIKKNINALKACECKNENITQQNVILENNKINQDNTDKNEKLKEDEEEISKKNSETTKENRENQNKLVIPLLDLNQVKKKT